MGVENEQASARAIGKPSSTIELATRSVMSVFRQNTETWIVSIGCVQRLDRLSLENLP